MALKLNSSGGGSITLEPVSTANNVTIAVPAADSGSMVFSDSSGFVTATTATVTENSTKVATTSFVHSILPRGTILLWSGASTAIPTGWALCDGTLTTPNLRDRFVVGAGTTYAVNATGGSANAVVVSHTHAATVSDPGHAHNLDVFARSVDGSSEEGDDTVSSTSAGVSGFIESATTGITVSNTSTGVSGTNANLPPYYALCYIMKVTG